MNMVIKIKYNFQVRPNNEEENKQRRNTHTHKQYEYENGNFSKASARENFKKKAQTYGKKKIWKEERKRQTQFLTICKKVYLL